MKVLVTGASGFVGSALTKRLIERGYEVVGISRNPQKQKTAIGLLWCSLEMAPETEAVVHLAGENVFGIWTESKKKRIYESRMEGTRQLLKVIRSWSTKPQVLVGASAVGIYGDRGDEVLIEDSSVDPQNAFLSKVCHDWEAENLLAEKEGIRVVNPRFGLVMDPEGGMLGKQWMALQSKVCLMPANPEAFLPWISLQDLVELLIFSLEHVSIQGSVNATAPDPVKASAWVEGLDHYFKFWVKGFLPEAFLSPLGKEFCRVLYGSQKVIPERLLQSGFKFRHSTWNEYLAFLFSKK